MSPVRVQTKALREEAWAALGNETRVAVGIRAELNNSAPGSQYIFIFIFSLAHLSEQSAHPLPECIFFFRPHKYLNKLMIPLEELKRHH